ncbi:hypothetical protein PR202_gb14728 [Eleusine coracana subsp. coracana]|uniref:BHLH domain-containing protein n=1 Tax=Eleusine coracana subsp. coracana TaxID=191504 RepID=A0AAV5EX18_ELECO|nr:hypothetical protein PR202_gb14728 [Eleusine coracana subsp. coracana]
MQRSELLRELYKSLLSGECDHRAARPAAALSPEDLGDTEWYYVISMTYAFRPGQGLPGRTFMSNEHIWLCNAHLADSRSFPRALLVKTIVCIPLMSGVLELGTTESVTEDPDLVSRATTSFWELPFPACTEEPCSSPSANETGEAEDINAFEDLDHNAMEAVITGGQEELSEVEMLLSASLQHVTNEIDEFSSLCEELDVQPLQDDWIMEESFEIPCYPEAAGATNDAGNVSSTPVDRVTSFMAWTGTDSDEASVPIIREPQKLLKKVVAGGAWESCVGGNTARSTQESGIKNHVMSERRRREKLNEMFLILKSLVPTINKVDKASILAETIAYLKELERRVRELESKHIMQPSETIRLRGRHNNEIIEKRVSGAKRNKASELSDDAEREHHWVLSKDGTSNVTVTVTNKEVLLEVHCEWEKMLMTRVFDAIKTIHLDVLSVQASTRDGFMGLKIRAQFANSAATVPRIISEAVRKAIAKK